MCPAVDCAQLRSRLLMLRALPTMRRGWVSASLAGTTKLLKRVLRRLQVLESAGSVAGDIPEARPRRHVSLLKSNNSYDDFYLVLGYDTDHHTDDDVHIYIMVY